MPLSIERTNHINQLLRPFHEANAFYREVFSAVQYMDSYDEGERRDASLLVIGQTPIEIFAPRDDLSLLGSSLAKYGPSFHSFEFQVDDLERSRAIFEELGVRITTYRENSFFMTHPKDGHGILFEICPFEMNNDPRLIPGWSDAPWRDGPLGLDRLNAMGIAVRDVDAVSSFVRTLTGSEEVYRRKLSGVGTAVGIWAQDLMIELVEPDGDASPVAAFIDRYGPRIRSLNFRVNDVSAVRDHFTEHGLATAAGDTSDMLALDPQDNFGALYQFSEARLPDDPRDG
ncbi:VOC family protein [Jatrophihabitans sp. DSM 45814]